MKIASNRVFFLILTVFLSFNIAYAFDDEEEEGGSSSAKPAPTGSALYTQVNIWYEKPMKILPLFHKGVMIPAGTKVTLGDTNRKALVFTREDGMRFRIYSYKYYQMHGDEMAALIFGKDNPMAKGGKFHKFTKMEREQIKRGKLKKGMSREAAIMAYGYPPTHVNPDVNADTWQLWENRWNRLIVYFKNNKIDQIQD